MPIWYPAVIVALAVLGELYALKKHEGTWTEYTRRFFGTKGRPLRWQAPKAVLLATLAWMAVHFSNVLG